MKRKAKDAAKASESPAEPAGDKVETDDAEATSKPIDGEAKSETETEVAADVAKSEDESKSDEEPPPPASEESEAAENVSTPNTDDASETKKVDEEPEKPSISVAAGDDNLIVIEDPDDYLMYLETILKKIHGRFYEFYDETKQVGPNEMPPIIVV